MALVPVTGEVLDLDAPNETLVDALFRMRDLEQQLQAARRDVGLEITRRMDADNLRQVDVDGFRVTVSAPGEDWDLEALDEVLTALVDNGILTPAATQRLFRVKRDVDKREMKKLLGNVEPVDAGKIRGCSAKSKRLRSVRVEDRSGGNRGWSR